MNNWRSLFTISDEEYNSLDRECMDLIEKSIQQAWQENHNYVPLYMLWHASHSKNKWSVLLETLEFLDGNGISYYNNPKNVALFSFNLEDANKAVIPSPEKILKALDEVSESAKKMAKALASYSEVAKPMLNPTNKMTYCNDVTKEKC